MGEVAVDERSVDELIIALAHLTERSAGLRRAIGKEDEKRQQVNSLPFFS